MTRPEPASSRTPLRIWLVGFGTVGQWLARALDSQAQRLARDYGVRVTVVALANARDGFISDEHGLDLPSATEADLLVEVASSPAGDGEPGIAHMREALQRGIPVVTSNKWPVALRGVELAELARSRGQRPKTSEPKAFSPSCPA